MKITKLFLLTLLLVFTVSNAHAGTTDVLVALEEIKGSIETGITPRNFESLRTKATVAINIAKRNKKISPEFIKTAKTALGSYAFSLEFLKMANEFADLGDTANARKTLKTAQEAVEHANAKLDELYSLAE